jgi:hemoglobin
MLRNRHRLVNMGCGLDRCQFARGRIGLGQVCTALLSEIRLTAATAETLPMSPFERIGGHAAMQAITEHFYDLMDQNPAFAELRAIHAADLTLMRESLPLFLAGWAGGPRDWFERNPGKCMMRAHGGIAITQVTADQWAEAMNRAIAATGVADREIADAMADVLARMARGMARDWPRIQERD